MPGSGTVVFRSADRSAGGNGVGDLGAGLRVTAAGSAAFGAGRGASAFGGTGSGVGGVGADSGPVGRGAATGFGALSASYTAMWTAWNCSPPPASTRAI